LTPYVLHRMGDDGYGLWTLSSSLVGYFGLFDLGVSQAVARHIAYYRGKGDKGSESRIASTSLVFLIALGAVAMFATQIVAAPLAGLFRVSSTDVAAFVSALRILGASIATSLVGNLFSGVLRAHERYRYLNATAIVVAAIRAVATVVVLELGGGIVSVAFVSLAAGIIGCVANIAGLLRWPDGLELSATRFSKDSLREVLSYSPWVFLLLLGYMIAPRIDAVVIGSIMTMRDVTVYAGATLVIGFMVMLMGNGFSALAQRFAISAGAGDTTSSQGLFLTSLGLSAAMACGGGALAATCFPGFLELWFGVGYGAAVSPFRVLALGNVAVLLQSPALSYAISGSSPRPYALLVSAEAAFNVVLSVWLGKSFGLVGVALGTTIPMLIFRGATTPLLMVRGLGVRMRDYLGAVFPWVVSGCTSSVFGIAVLDELGRGGVSGLVLSAMATVACFLAVAGLFFLLSRRRDEVPLAYRWVEVGGSKIGLWE